MKPISEYTSFVENGIRQLKLPMMELPGLYDPIVYAMNAGGKRLRPVMMLMTAEAYGLDIEKCLKPAIGIEMFHNFTLLHDDVMDKSDTRRGRLTVHKKWDENTAILSGDAMLTLANYLMCEVDHDKMPDVLKTFNDGAFQIYEGQTLDMDFETSENVSLDDYILMVSKKTAALLGISSKIGAIIAGAPKEEAEAFYEFGMQLGVAFQIQDDYLDVYGDAATFGKPIGGDILNGKKTFLLLSALATDDADSKALRVAMTLPDNDLKIRTVRNIYTKMGIPEICDKAIASRCSLALKALKKTSVDEEAKEAFRHLVDKLIDRKK